MDSSFNGLLSVANYSSYASEHGKNVLQKVNTNEIGSNEPKSYSFSAGARKMILGGPLNILLPCVIIGMLSYYCNWNDGVTFAFTLLAIAPLAERLGFCTEQLALHTNDSIGGLLNATFGNATEVIVGITALLKGLYRVVQLSLLGSILSNLLLVLGCAFFFGGLKYKTQSYGKISSQISSSLLILSTMCLVFPAVLTSDNEENHSSELNYSRGVSVIMLLTYGVFIYFQIFTHRYLYEEDGPKEKLNSDITINTTVPDHGLNVDDSLSSSPSSPLHTKSAVVSIGATSTNFNISTSSTAPTSTKIDAIISSNGNNNGNSNSNSNNSDMINSSTITAEPKNGKSLHSVEQQDETDDDNEEEEEEEDILGFNYACFWLTIITVLIAILSDAISSTIQDAGNSYNISGVFLSTIVLPIIGNAAEHASAIIFGMRNKLDLSLGIAIGSSCQISAFVIPLMVVVGWIGNKDMSLNFGFFESMTMFLTVIGVTFAIKDGTSNFFIGFVLIIGYFIIAASFMAKYDEPLDSSQ